ncbi:hypothetical protein D9M72_342420 [compost metagenome]
MSIRAAAHQPARGGVGRERVGLRIHPRAQHRVAQRGIAVSRLAVGLVQPDQRAGGLLEAGGRTQHQAALEAGSGHGHLPAGAFRSQAVFHRHAHVVEEDLGETGLAVELADRAHGDARRIERHQHEGQPVVSRRGRIGAEQPEQPVRPHRPRRPDLLAVDDVVIAVAARAAADRGHVGTGVRLGPALRPDMLARGHARQEARLLRRGAELHQRRPEQEDAVLVDAHRRAGAPVFFLEDEPLDQVAAAPAQFGRPRDHAPAALVERGFPGAVLGKAFPGVEAGQRRARHVRSHPVAHLGAEGALGFGVFKLHRAPLRSLCGHRRSWLRGLRQRQRALRRNPRSYRPAA